MQFKYLIPVFILITLLVSRIYSQDRNLKNLKKYYSEQQTDEPLNIFSDTLSEFYQIILIRHGEPNLDKKGWRNREEAIVYMQQYDSVGIIPFTTGPLNLENIPIDTILHSSLNRAMQTSQLAFNEEFILKEDSCYREFERKTMKWCNIKMPTRCWTTGSRILWFLGLNDKNIESFRDAKKRAMNNAEKLAYSVHQNGMVIIVAHGLHNKYVKKYLRKSKWQQVYNNGNGYLSVKIMAQIPKTY